MRSLAMRLFLLLFLLPVACFAQSTGRLTGTVTDSSSALIPGAKVTSVNLGTNVKAETVTTSSGTFVLPDLPIGNYKIIVEAPGFSTLVEQPVQILTGHVEDLQLRLNAGAVEQVMEVSASAALIQTTTSEVQTTIEAREIQELPLDGRNPLQLVVLTPGATFTSAGTIAGQQDNTGVSVNGLRATDNNYTLDGGTYTNRNFDSAPTLPNPDMLEEFTVKAANFSSQFGGAGAVVQLSTRSGTNRIHGSIFEYLRNDKMDAESYFATTRLPYKRNQFGGTIGGPIVRDRTFYFGAYQGTRQRGNPSARSITPPSPDQRNGIFKKNIYDPLTGLQFPGNTIPSSRFNPINVQLSALIPPADPGKTTLVVVPDSDLNDDQFLARVDHTFSDRNHLAVRYFWDHDNFQRDTSSVPGIYAYNKFDNQAGLVRDTMQLSGRTSVVATFTYLRNFRQQLVTSPTTMLGLGAKVPLASSISQPEIRVNISGYVNIFGGGPLYTDPQVYEGRLEASHTRGNHFIQAGAMFADTREESLDVSVGSGNWTYTGARTAKTGVSGTGDAYADFLLGLTNVFTQTASQGQSLREKSFALYVQDDWRAAPRLTLNLGLRWEPWLPATDEQGPFGGLDPGKQSTVAMHAPVGIVFSGDAGIPNSLIRNQWNNFAPRVGFAYNVYGNGDTAFRGAYGVFYRSAALNIQRFIGANMPFRSLGVQINAPASSSDPYASRVGGNPFPWTPPTLAQIGQYVFPSPVKSALLDPNTKTSYTQAWNASIDQKLGKTTALTIGYVGNHAIRIISAIEGNPAVYKAGATTANTQTRRLNTALDTTTYLTPFQSAKYNALQVSIRRRSTRGLTMLANYVWSKTLDNNSDGSLGTVSVIDPFNPGLYEGPADFDVRHRAKISFVYGVPDKPTSHRFVNELLGKWRLNSIIVAQSGMPFSVTSGRDNSFSGVNKDLADVVGITARPAGVDPLAKWFNTAAFVTNAVGTFGNSGRNSMRGPKYINIDLSVVRVFPIREWASFELRGEAFNVLNHPNFDTPAVNQSSGTFGKITSTAGNPRVGQVAARIRF